MQVWATTRLITKYPISLRTSTSGWKAVNEIRQYSSTQVDTSFKVSSLFASTEERGRAQLRKITPNVLDANCKAICAQLNVSK